MINMLPFADQHLRFADQHGENTQKEQSDEIQTLKSELITLKNRCEQYEQAYESLTHQMIELIRNRFGRKSERYIDPRVNNSVYFLKITKYLLVQKIMAIKYQKQRLLLLRIRGKRKPRATKSCHVVLKLSRWVKRI